MNITDKLYNVFTKNKLVVIIIVLVGLISGIYTLWPNNQEGSLEVNNSPNSINTVNQVGDNKISVEGQILNPGIVSQIPKTLNVSIENGYQQTYRVTISNPSNEQFGLGILEGKKDFEIKKFNFNLEYIVVDKGATVHDYKVVVVTDKIVSEEDLKFVILEDK